MEYEKYHILDFVVEDETQHNGRDIRVSVDTHEMVTIEIGNSVTIRTDEAGVDDLRDAFHRALIKLTEIRYQRVTKLAAVVENEMIQAGIDARETDKAKKRSEHKKRSAQQDVDIWTPNDPVNW
jgi:hypothetical protein